MKHPYKIVFALIILISLCSCKPDSNPEKILPLKKISLKVPEPSGLTLSDDTKTFWTISDEDSMVYQLNMNGKILKSFNYNGYDAEGITLVEDSLVVVLLERTREAVIFDTSGNELKRIDLKLEGKNDNHGIEGIAYNPLTNHFFIIKEKEPCLLLEYDFQFKLIRKDTLIFSTDVSGLFFDSSENQLWILSDENSSVFILDSNRNVQRKITLGITQPEGIAINFTEKLLYIVTDKEPVLFIYKLE